MERLNRRALVHHIFNIAARRGLWRGRHSDPTITAEVFGHLDLEDMREGISRLQFGAGGSSMENAIYVRPVASAPAGSGRSG
jgi:hypothetical protein